MTGVALAPGLPGWAGAMLLGAAALLDRRPGGWLLLLASAFVIGGWSRSPPHLPLPEGLHRLEGTVRRADDAGLELLVDGVDGAPSRAVARLSGPAEALRPGDRLLLRARLRALRPPANPGEWDDHRARWARGVRATGGFLAGSVVVVERGRLLPWVERQRARVADVVRRTVEDPAAAALVLTLAVGERAAMGDEAEEAFARSGLVHVLSVSGLHVAVLAVGVFVALRWALTRRMSRWARSSDARWVAAVAASPVVWGYVAFTGNQAPAVRSALMVSLVLSGWLVRRRSDALSSVMVALGAMCAVDGGTPFDLSVQLSFSAVLGMVFLSPPLRRGLPVPGPSARARGLRRRVEGWREAVVQTVAVSVAVTLATAPLVLMAFQRLSVVGVVSNVVTLPVMGALTVSCALGAAVALVAPPLAGPVLWVAGQLAAAVSWVAGLLGGAPLAAVTFPGPSWPVATAWWAGLAMVVLAPGRWRRVGWAAAVAAVVVHLGTTRPRADRVEVTFLAVGHGDAVVIRAGGVAALIDGGGSPEGSDTGRRFVLPFLRQAGIGALKLMALSHAHPDHALGLVTAAEELPVERLWLPRGIGRGPLVEDVLDAAEGARAEEVDASEPPLTLGPAQLTVLAPVDGRLDHDRENDRSLVLVLEHGAVRFLFTGDLEAPGEVAVRPGPVTVMKAPHHGSDTSSTPELLADTRPRFVVFCVGVNNRYRFPREEVVERYRAVGSRCYRTDRHGAIRFVSDGTDVTVEPFLTGE